MHRLLAMICGQIICDSFTRSNCTQRFFLGNRLRFPCGNDTVAVAMQFAMKNGQICFSLRKFLAISPAIQKIASDCGCDAVVHLARETLFTLFRGLGPESHRVSPCNCSTLKGNVGHSGQRLTLLVRRPPGGWGLPREGVVAEKFVPSLESLSSLGFEERNLGYPGNFAGMSRTPGGFKNFVPKKVRAPFSFPIMKGGSPGRSFWAEVWAGVFGGVFELVLLEYLEQNKLQQKHQPRIPMVLHSKTGETSGRGSAGGPPPT